MDKSDKFKVLDTINQWINNCDTKASIFLAVYGIFISFIVSSEIIKAIINIIRINISTKTPCSIAYLILLAVAIILMGIGMYKLVRVLIPTINLNHTSVMFFGSVASYGTFDVYVDATKKEEKNIEDDLLHQIFAASKICNQKFENQKKGICLSSFGFGIVIVWLFIGFFVYYI